MRVNLYLVPGFSFMTLAFAIDPMRLANRLSGKEFFTWRLLSDDGKPVKAENGVTCSVDGAAGEDPALHSKNALSLICAGEVSVHEGMSIKRRWLQLEYERGNAVGGIRGGVHFLAAAGLLDGLRAVAHWETAAKLSADYPEIDVSFELYLIENNIYTCAGETATLDMMLHVIERELGTTIAASVCSNLTLEKVRDPAEHQRRPLAARVTTRHPRLLLILRLMEDNVESPLSLVRIAQRIGLSRRQMERLFRMELGCTPKQHYMTVRLQHASALLSQTSLPVASVSLTCGFVSPSHFSRCYRGAYKRTPQAARRLTRRDHTPAVETVSHLATTAS